jgi:RNA polymerase sigma-70 factor (ECF subfamily)
MTIARNVAIDHFRRRRTHEPLDEASHLADRSDASTAVEMRSDCERLRRLLAGFDERDRELIALKYGAGLTNRAIARLTGLSESNVGTILHRTVKSLRAAWEPGMEEGA